MNSRRRPTRSPLSLARLYGTRGFTLAELLVAVTLLSIVMTSVYSLAHSAMRTWRGVESGHDIYLEARNAMTLFSHEYHNIVGRAAHLFEGEGGHITMFLIGQPQDLDQGEGNRLMRVTYSYNRTKRSIEREEALVEAALPLPNADGTPIDSGRIRVGRRHKTTVADHVERFRFRYVWAPLPIEVSPYEPPIPEPLIFMDRHQSRWGLPQAVEISLELRDPEDAEQQYTLTTMLPMRAPSYRRPRHLMEEMLNAGV